MILTEKVYPVNSTITLLPDEKFPNTLWVIVPEGNYCNLDQELADESSRVWRRVQ